MTWFVIPFIPSASKHTDAPVQHIGFDDELEPLPPHVDLLGFGGWEDTTVEDR